MPEVKEEDELEAKLENLWINPPKHSKSQIRLIREISPIPFEAPQVLPFKMSQAYDEDSAFDSSPGYNPDPNSSDSSTKSWCDLSSTANSQEEEKMPDPEINLETMIFSDKLDFVANKIFGTKPSEQLRICEKYDVKLTS